MELADIFTALRRRWYLVLLVMVAAGGAVAMAAHAVHSTESGTATVQLLVDSPQSALTDVREDPTPLVTRATVFAQLMTSSDVLRSVAAEAKVNPADLTAEGPFSGAGQSLNTPTPSEARGVQIVSAKSTYHLAFVPQTDIPIVTVTVLGPSAAGAGTVAAAVVPGVQAWLNELPLSGSVPKAARVTIRQLGSPQVGAISTSSSKKIIAGIAGVGVLILGLLVILAFEGRRNRRAASLGGLDTDPAEHWVPDAGEAPDEPAVSDSRAGASTSNPAGFHALADSLNGLGDTSEVGSRLGFGPQRRDLG